MLKVFRQHKTYMTSKTTISCKDIKTYLSQAKPYLSGAIPVKLEMSLDISCTGW